MSGPLEAETERLDSLAGLNLGHPPVLPEIEIIQFFTPEQEQVDALKKLNQAGRVALSLGVAIAAAVGLVAVARENKKDFVVAGLLGGVGLTALYFDLGDLAINHIEAAIEE